MSNHTEEGLWHIIQACGWSWWLAIAALAGWCLFETYRLSAPATRYGRLHRAAMMIGLFLIATSWLNSAFGPIGLPLVLIGLRGLLHQMYMACLRDGKITRTEGSLGQRFYQLMVHSPRPH